VGGQFTTYAGASTNRIAKLNATTGALDTTFDIGTGFTDIVYSIILDGAGSLYVGGSFSGYKTSAARKLAKLDTTTAALDTTFSITGTGFSSTVWTIALDGSGGLYAGGLFTAFNGVTRERIAKLNATTAALDTTFDSASGTNGNVLSLAVDGAGSLYVGGSFTSYKGVTRQRIAKLDATTAALDTTFNKGFVSATEQIKSFVIDQGYVLYGGTSITEFIAADATTGTINFESSPLGSYTMLASDNGRVLVVNSASSVTISVPSGLDVGYRCLVIQIGSGQVTLSGSGTTLYSASGLSISAQHGSANIVGYASNIYNVSGNLS
jgi:hypothetical protein